MTATTSGTTGRNVGLLPLAEIALAGVSLATVAGMWRLFADGSYFAPLAGHVVAAHLLAAVLRRRGVSLAASAAIMAVVAALALSWAHLGDTTALGLPTGATVGGARDRLEQAWRLFDEVRAPAPVLPGFLLAAGAAVWAAAFLADVAAFRLWTSFEPLVPSATIFVFASLFAAERGRAGAAAVWLAAALAFTLLHRTVRQHSSPSWLGSDPRLGTLSLLKVGGGLLAAAVLAGWVLGPRLPGAAADPIVAVRDLDDGGGSRETISPLVEIKGRLVNRSDAELFTVRTPQRAYWRLTALDEFDGDVWSSRGTFGGADGALEDAGDAAPGSVEVSQRFAISGLAAIWLPAAFEPRSIEPGDGEVRWEAESSTLIVSDEEPTSDGFTYEVTSALPIGLTAEQLAASRGPVPPDILDRNLDLPSGFPVRVAAEAQRIVTEAGASTPYDQAMALQNYFRDGSFTYTLDAPPSHSGAAIEAFLFQSRAGYCEQFAGSYAAMARAVGLPSRVAVGFTPGERDPAQPDLYRVRGEHAHAWPEVWIPTIGWLAFEPTPGRGAPNAAYTGVPESQAATNDPTTATTPTSTAAPATVTTLVPGAPTTLPPGVDAGAQEDPLTPQAADDGVGVAAGLRMLALALALGAAVLLLVAAVVAGSRALRRWRRRTRATTPDAVVRAAWADAVDAVSVLGVVPRRHDTPVELAARAARAVGSDAATTPLAWLVERADYAAEGVDDGQAAEARRLAAAVRDAVHARTTRRARLLAAVDPRPPARRGPARAPRPSDPRLQVSGAG